MPFYTNPLASNRNFRLLFSAQVISLTGSGATTVGLALFAYQLVGGDSAAIVIGNALMLRILAFLLFSQLAGILADRLNRKHILIAADLVRFVLVAMFPFIQYAWQIYVLIFLINAATAFFTPTFDSTIPSVVGQEHYVKALSLSRVATDLEALAAPLLAGVLLALMGFKGLFWFNAGTYLISAVLVAASSLCHTPKPASPFLLCTFLQELSYGMKAMLRHAVLQRALMYSFVEAIAGAAAIVTTVIYVRDVLVLGESSFILVMAALGLGSMLAALVLGQATGRYESTAKNSSELHGLRHRWIENAMFLGSILLGLLLLPGALQPPLLIFAVLWFLNGVGQALIAIPSSTLLAEHTTEVERGRVYAAYFALTHAFWLITYPAIGYGTSILGAPIIFTVAGIVCLLIVLIVFLSPRTSADHVHDSPSM